MTRDDAKVEIPNKDELFHYILATNRACVSPVGTACLTNEVMFFADFPVTYFFLFSTIITYSL